MDVDTIFQRFPSLLYIESDATLLAEFQKLKTNFKKVEYCSNLLNKYQSSFLKDNEKLNIANNCLNLTKIIKEGDNFLSNHEHMSALREYNKCLCRTSNKIMSDKENENENMRKLKMIEMTIYWKRAQIYEELHLSQECLENLEKMEKLRDAEGFVMDDVSKVRKLKESCLKAVTNDVPGCQAPKVTHKSKPNIPFIAQSINLSFSPIFGYHLTAKQNLKPGTVIMTESPYSAPLLPDVWYEKCATCLKCAYLNLIPCTKCSNAMFCSELCMQKGFREFHQYECPIMQDILELLSPEAMIGLRNTLKGFCLYENLNELQDVFDHRHDGRQEDFDLDVMECDLKTIFRVICHQATNQEMRSVEDLLNLSLTAGVIYKLLVFKTDLVLKLETSSQHYLLMEMLLHFLQVATINSFSMTSLPEISLNNSKGTRFETEHEFAIATYPFSSFLNHSCAPNVTKTNAGPNHETMLVVVTRPIKANDQIFDCYFSAVHHNKSKKEERQKLLFEQYNFKCSCLACQLDYPLYNDLKVKCPMLNLIEIISENASLGRYSNKALVLQKYQEYCHFLKEFDECYPCKEIYVVHKCLLRCIWLLYKRPQLMFKPVKSRKDIN